jgi:bifunctional DNA-binding transcriptional regulator/antitoxin component of YhaV-PrlF toxin-antitoxin module
LSVKVDKYGRIVLSKKLQKKYGIEEGMRLIVTECLGCISLIPVKRYEKPTEAMYGSIKIDVPIDNPNQVAREHIRRQSFEKL